MSVLISKDSFIYCDGACNSITIQGWGTVSDSDGRCLLSKNKSYIIHDMIVKDVTVFNKTWTVIVADFADVKTQNNNGAELLALVAAFRIAIANNIRTIKCDSDLLVKWWSKGHISKKAKCGMDKEKYSMILECVKLRTLFESNGGILEKISGDNNLADLGWHKRSLS